MMNPDVYTKDGTMRKRAPKKYKCRTCEHLFSKSGSIKMPGITFGCCPKCGSGKYDETESHKEWWKLYEENWNNASRTQA